jgi:hypothetical protein
MNIEETIARDLTARIDPQTGMAAAFRTAGGSGDRWACDTRRRRASFVSWTEMVVI